MTSALQAWSSGAATPSGLEQASSAPFLQRRLKACVPSVEERRLLPVVSFLQLETTNAGRWRRIPHDATTSGGKGGVE